MESKRSAIGHRRVLRAGSPCGKRGGRQGYRSKRKPWGTNQGSCLGLREDGIRPLLAQSASWRTNISGERTTNWACFVKVSNEPELQKRELKDLSHCTKEKKNTKQQFSPILQTMPPWSRWWSCWTTYRKRKPPTARTAILSFAIYDDDILLEPHRMVRSKTVQMKNKIVSQKYYILVVGFLKSFKSAWNACWFQERGAQYGYSKQYLTGPADSIL